MAGEACSPTCGFCGMCDDDGDLPLHFQCLWCHADVISRSGDDDHYPFCSRACAVRADTNDRDPRRI